MLYHRWTADVYRAALGGLGTAAGFGSALGAGLGGLLGMGESFAGDLSAYWPFSVCQEGIEPSAWKRVRSEEEHTAWA